MAEQELKKLQDKCDALLAELVVITNEMGRKCLSLFRTFPCFYFSELSLASINNLTLCSLSFFRVL